MKLAKSLLATCLLSASLGTALAAQPATGGYEVIQQASGECGPTTTWLMLNHYYQGSILRTGSGRYDYYNATLPPVCIGTQLECSSRQGSVRGASEYLAWTEMQRDGQVGPSLRFLGERLLQMRDPVDGNNLFEVAGDYSVPAQSNTAARQQRLEGIREHLDADRPVVIHLARPLFIPGHYIALVGYEETAQGRVYRYADTVQPETLLRVSEQALVGADAWYRSGESAYLARWNGRFMTFWPTTPVLPAAPEPEPVEETAEETTTTSGGWLSSLWSLWRR